MWGVFCLFVLGGVGVCVCFFSACLFLGVLGVLGVFVCFLLVCFWGCLFVGCLIVLFILFSRLYTTLLGRICTFFIVRVTTEIVLWCLMLIFSTFSLCFETFEL